MKAKYLIKHVIGSLVFFAILFISAGRIDYWQGWIYVGIGMIMLVLNYTVLRIDPELLKERSGPGTNTKKWDKIILGISLLVTIIMYVTAGLDSGRYSCSPEFPLVLLILGIILTAAGQLIFLIAQKQNRFFSSTVRVQQEREHQVCDTGIYRFVRHPAYMGSVVQAFGFPLLFGSVWSIIPVILMVILLITRTSLEDKTLKEELKGYIEYSKKTKYKMFPYIW